MESNGGWPFRFDFIAPSANDSRMKIIVGLGNPGLQYRGTRHNVGWEVLAELSRRGGDPKPSVKHQAELVELFIDGEKTLLVAPQTFMNLSGRAVRPLVQFYQTELADLLVVCDDLNLDVGRLRLRAAGTAGGQKGLQDIITNLGGNQFPRLRIGIGRPPGRMDAADYVLGKFTKDERVEMDIAVLNAADGVEQWIREGVQKTMNKLNAPPADEAE